jgi:hypothetical protein
MMDSEILDAEEEPKKKKWNIVFTPFLFVQL